MNDERDAARRSILDAIRRSLAASAPFDEAATSLPEVPAPRAFDVAPLERFRKALEAVVGKSVVVANECEAAGAVREILERIGARRVAVSDSPLVGAVLGHLALDDVRMESDPDRATLFECHAGITGAQWAVAETGTLVLESDRERHRLASLVPPVHIAILEASRIRHTLGEVLGTLSKQGADALSRTVTFVTGPSRTSDIELTLAIGVHGPGELYVVILDGDGHG
jgi:L-lactate dehydrogenase complex protein LldG